MTKPTTKPDLSFFNIKPTGNEPEEDYMISPGSERGAQWLKDNWDGPDLEKGVIPPLDAWVETKAEFDRLYKKAVADGLLVRPR
jgi:hypothetical protein